MFTEPPVEAGLETHGPSEHVRVQTAMRLCTATNFVGMPAVAVPAGIATGLPQGMQLIGGLYREGLCLVAAAAIEKWLSTIVPTDPRSYPWTGHR